MSADPIGTLEKYLENGDLPKLPGFQIRTPNIRPQAKPQQLRYINGIPGLYPESAKIHARPKSAPVRKPVPPPSLQRSGRQAASQQLQVKDMNVVEQQPAWLAYDRQVLRYYGYVKETVSERRDEVLRVRKLVILYYLADDSIYIAEPKEANSGLPQGPFLKRHKVIRPETGEHVSFRNLVVGGGVTLYGRAIHICGCDEFTRAFLTDKGYSVRPNTEPPLGDIKRPTTAPGRSTKEKVKESSRSRKFIDYDRVVLRFHGVWDDSKTNEFGKRHRFVIHFYLADDTIEIVETHERNSGYSEFSNFLRRCRLPKTLPQVGMRPMSADSRSSSPYPCYSAEDLNIGSVLTVYTREIVIHDCDDFTREYCVREMGRRPEDMRAVPIEEAKRVPVRVEPPPYRGGISMIGGERDSLQSCIHLVPKPPSKNLVSFMEKDGKVMRFLAAFTKSSSSGPGSGDFDFQRRFLVNFFLVDDTLSVFEPPVRNSGIVGGKFFERGECKNSITGDFYGQEDLFVGAVITVSNRDFELLQADDYTLKYMEEHAAASFPQSDLELVLSKVKEQIGSSGIDRDGLLSHLGDDDGKGYGVASLHACINASGCAISKQEAVTILRSFGKEKCSIDDILRILQ